MATNPPAGDGHRNGAVRQRSQTYNPKTEPWVKRDTNTGRFMDVKKDGTPFKESAKRNDAFWEMRQGSLPHLPRINIYN